MPEGTGPWKLETYDQSTSARFVRNDAWWGGATPLDAVEWVFFDETGPMVTAYQGGQIDAIVQFDVFSGTALFNDPNFQVNESETTNHRQIWFRTDTGQFTDKRVRQAVALSLDREAMVAQLFQGRGDVANDHVIFSLYPYFDPAVPQRTRDVEKAKQLLTEANATGLTATLHVAELQEIPDLAVLIQSQAAEAGITLTPAVESLDTFYGAQWCPTEPASPPCSGAAELGIVDYGHRSTPDVFLNSALRTGGVWNSSQYSSQAFDDAFAEFQAAVGVDAQTDRLREDRDDPQRRRRGLHPVHLFVPVGQRQDVHRHLLQRAGADVRAGRLEGRLTQQLTQTPTPTSEPRPAWLRSISVDR